MTKIALAALMTVAIISAPALGARKNAAPSGPTYPHIFSGGADQGSDPSGLVRLDLMRDPPFGGSGQ